MTTYRYEIRIDKHLWVPKAALSLNAQRSIKSGLTLTDPKDDWYLWDEVDGYLVLPRAFPLQALPDGWVVADTPGSAPIRRLPKNPLFELDARIVDGRRVPQNTNLQRKAVQAILSEPYGGQIQLYCGAGKTAVGLMAAHLNSTAFVVVADNTTLLEQWEEQVKRLLHMTPMWATTKKESWVNGDAVLTTYQGLARACMAGQLHEVESRFGLILFDEAHHVSARSFSVCAEAFSGKRIGLTATPHRADGLHIIQRYHLGEVLYKNLRAPLKPVVYLHSTSFQPDNSKDIASEKDLAGLAADLGVIEERSMLIADMLKQWVAEGRKVLVLSSSITALGNAMACYLGSPHRIPRTTRGERPKVLQEILKGSTGVGVLTRELPRAADKKTSRVMFAVARFGREAYDDEELDTVLLMEPVRDKGLLQQILGRPCRVFPGKKAPQVHVLVDRQASLRSRAANMRSLLRKWEEDAGGEHEVITMKAPLHLPLEARMSFVEKWENCTRCALGTLRTERVVIDSNRYRTKPPVLLGEGGPRGVLFVGDPPNEAEEVARKPFASELYGPVRSALSVLSKANIPVYLTHALGCRPCMKAVNPDGSARVDLRTKLPIYKDILPPKDATDACRARLHEEIYEVDPVLIVALGKDALRAITGKYHTDMDRGQLLTITLEGVTPIPSLNNKGVWERKVRVGGKMVLSRPTEPIQVPYSVYLTSKLHPVLTFRASDDPHREREVFTSDMIQVVRIWKMLERMRRP